MTAAERPRGRVWVLQERCKGCTFCVEFCPQHVLEMAEQFNAKGYHFPFARAPEDCVNCQLCYYLCPEFAIFVTEANSDGRRGGADPAQRTSVQP